MPPSSAADTGFVASLSADIPRSGARPLATAQSERALLGLLVAAGALARLVAGMGHSTPRLYPDEYIYSSLARSLAHGELAIRGEAAHFPALLEPLLSAPFWLAGDPALAFTLTKALHGVVMPLAAIPVWLIARRLGLGRWERLACAALTVALPGAVYAAYATADAIGVTLALAALAAGLRALKRPTPRAELLFLSLACLATLARVQYIVLPVAFVLAALVGSSSSPRRLLRSYRVTTGAAGAALVLALAAGPAQLLGYYEGVLELDVGAGVARWLVTDAALAAYAAGWVIVPAAVAGWGLALIRPRTGAERTYAVFLGGAGGLVLAEAAVYAANGADRFHERYLLALLPLALPYALVALRRGGRDVAIVSGCAAVVLFLLAARLPLSEHTAGFRKQDSPFLQAVAELEGRLGVGTAGLVVGALAGALALIAVVGHRLPRWNAVAASCALAIAVAATVGTFAFDRATSQRIADTLGGDPSWVDRSGDGPVDLLLLPRAVRAETQGTLFWNASITRLVRFPGADPVDDFAHERARLDAHGRIELPEGRPTRPFLVSETGSRLELTGARLVARSRLGRLWEPTGTPRATMLVVGVGPSGTLEPSSEIVVWRCASPQTVTFRAHALDDRRTLITLVDARGAHAVQLGRVSRRVELEVPPGRGPWEVALEAPIARLDGGRALSAVVQDLRLTADCR